MTHRALLVSWVLGYRVVPPFSCCIEFGASAEGRSGPGTRWLVGARSHIFRHERHVSQLFRENFCGRGPLERWFARSQRGLEGGSRPFNSRGLSHPGRGCGLRLRLPGRRSVASDALYAWRREGCGKGTRKSYARDCQIHPRHEPLFGSSRLSRLSSRRARGSRKTGQRTPPMSI